MKWKHLALCFGCVSLSVGNISENGIHNQCKTTDKIQRRKHIVHCHQDVSIVFRRCWSLWLLFRCRCHLSDCILCVLNVNCNGNLRQSLQSNKCENSLFRVRRTCTHTHTCVYSWTWNTFINDEIHCAIFKDMIPRSVSIHFHVVRSRSFCLDEDCIRVKLFKCKTLGAVVIHTYTCMNTENASIDKCKIAMQFRCNESEQQQPAVVMNTIISILNWNTSNADDDDDDGPFRYFCERDTMNKLIFFLSLARSQSLFLLHAHYRSSEWFVRFICSSDCTKFSKMSFISCLRTLGFCNIKRNCS